MMVWQRKWKTTDGFSHLYVQIYTDLMHYELKVNSGQPPLVLDIVNGMDSKLPARSVPRSRLPTASVSASSSGKRTATSAQLDGDVEHALDRRKAKVEAFSATMNKSSLERRVAAAEKSKRDIEIEYGKLKLDKDKVDRDRRWFSEREKQLSEERDAEHRAFEAEKVSTTSVICTLGGSWSQRRRLLLK